MKNVKILLMLVLIMIPLLIICSKSSASVRTYTVTSTSKPYQSKYIKSKSYNSYTKQYYMLRSYFEQLEKDGGGMLVLRRGTYTITNTLYVPSNVTVKLDDGVVIAKGTITGTNNLTPSSSIFQLIAPSKSSMIGVHRGYNGQKNIKFLGTGKVIIDLKYTKNCIGIIMGHNQNITVSNITFQKMYSGHFIEMDASKNVMVKDSVFKYHKDSPNNNKEAINLDTPDKATEGFHSNWSSYDKTPNLDINIQNNIFYSLERAIGTHKYSEGKYHTNINVRSNQITYCDQDAIRIMNWKSPIIISNTIDNVANRKGSYRAILISGVIDPIIRENTFKKVSRPIQIMPWQNNGPGNQYAITYNTIYQRNIDDMLMNTLINVSETFIRYNYSYKVYDRNTQKFQFEDRYIKYE